jgi:putative ABC transport system ATP-binding protein
MKRAPAEAVFDPVCGMDVHELTHTYQAVHEHKRMHFCSTHCRDRFKKEPKKFTGTPLISIRDMWKVFSMGDSKTEVLRGLSLNIWEGDFVVIIGPSGSGKSTALNMIGLLDRPTSGAYFLHSDDVSMLSDDERAHVRSSTFGFVFQQYNLIPWLTAYENAVMPLIFSRKRKKKVAFKHLFTEVGLGKRLQHRPTELSGGEQQRTALLRALANDPEILLADEPTGNLDSATGKLILDMLIDLYKVHKKTLLIVTHDSSIADMADQVLAFKDGRLAHDHEAQRRAYTS